MGHFLEVTQIEEATSRRFLTQSLKSPTFNNAIIAQFSSLNLNSMMKIGYPYVAEAKEASRWKKLLGLVTVGKNGARSQN